MQNLLKSLNYSRDEFNIRSKINLDETIGNIESTIYNTEKESIAHVQR